MEDDLEAQRFTRFNFRGYLISSVKCSNKYNLLQVPPQKEEVFATKRHPNRRYDQLEGGD